MVVGDIVVLDGKRPINLWREAEVFAEEELYPQTMLPDNVGLVIAVQVKRVGGVQATSYLILLENSSLGWTFQQERAFRRLVTTDDHML